MLKGPTKLSDQHIFPKQLEGWFNSRGVYSIDDYTISVESITTHLKAIHGKGNMGQTPGKWNGDWIEFMNANKNATPKEIYQHAGKMLDEYGLSGLSVHPYRK